MPSSLLSSTAKAAGRRPCNVPARPTSALTVPRVAARPGAIASRNARLQPLRVASEADAAADNAWEAVAITSPDNEMTLADIKAALLDSLYGTERGLDARSEIRAEINELISQLEAKNPLPNPTEALDQLAGTWKLMYTSSPQLTAVLALGKLPLVSVGEVTQRIDPENYTVENQVQLTVPFSRTTFSTTASFEVRSPKRLQLRLTKGGIQTPELSTDIELPSNVSIMGQSLDLSQLKSALSPVNDGLKGIMGQMNNILSQTPDLSVNIQNERAQTWQLNTYVDQDTRICRGDGGSVFIYVRDVSISTPTVIEPTSTASI